MDDNIPEAGSPGGSGGRCPRGWFGGPARPTPVSSGLKRRGAGWFLRGGSRALCRWRGRRSPEKRWLPKIGIPDKNKARRYWYRTGNRRCKEAHRPGFFCLPVPSRFLFALLMSRPFLRQIRRSRLRCRKCTLRRPRSRPGWDSSFPRLTPVYIPFFQRFPAGKNPENNKVFRSNQSAWSVPFKKYWRGMGPPVNGG